jgi:hypothetical protein
LKRLSAQITGLVAVVAAACARTPEPDPGPFRRIASFPVYLNTDESVETEAEIVAASDRGYLLVYTDDATGNIGFVDLSDPGNPLPAGVVELDGEPHAIVVAGEYALAAMNTSVDHAHPSGRLEIIEIDSRRIIRSMSLGGQPDAMALSPDGRYAVVAIENERDENLGDGRPPQAPPGFVVIVDLLGSPGAWTARRVGLVGVADRYSEDPEPEFVAINEGNVAAVTLQENNYIVLIDLRDGAIAGHFSAGTADLYEIDVVEDGVIELKGTSFNVPREPDGIAWISMDTFVTADEGDLDGGSRGFTIFDTSGRILFESGSSMEHVLAGLGYYPEDRSEDKGNEPEGVAIGAYGAGGTERYLFVGTERSNAIVVYRLERDPAGVWLPRLVQVLPAGVGPEGLLPIPQRNLFVVASEVDLPDKGTRSTIDVYEYAPRPARSVSASD